MDHPADQLLQPAQQEHLALTALRGVLTAGGRVVADPLWVARRDPERMKGLLGRDGLPRGQALLIERCSSVHTIGMRFTIDVLFLDGEGAVVRAVAGLRSWRMARGGRRARFALEVESGWLDPALRQPGTRFTWAGPELA